VQESYGGKIKGNQFDSMRHKLLCLQTDTAYIGEFR
jgi:hypothetical protein